MNTVDYQEVVSRLTEPYVQGGALSRPDDRYVYYRAVAHTMARALPVTQLRALCDLLNDVEFGAAFGRLMQRGLLVEQSGGNDHLARVSAC